jgi:hypothetical protein
MQQVDSGVAEPGPDGLEPREQLRRIRAVVDALLEEQYRWAAARRVLDDMMAESPKEKFQNHSLFKFGNLFA